MSDEYRKRRKKLAKDSVPSSDSDARYCPDCGGSIYYLRHPEYAFHNRRVDEEELPHYWCYYCLHFFQREDQLLDHAQLMARRKLHQ